MYSRVAKPRENIFKHKEYDGNGKFEGLSVDPSGGPGQGLFIFSQKENKHCALHLLLHFVHQLQFGLLLDKISLLS